MAHAIKWISELSRELVGQVGGKAAHLGELVKAGVGGAEVPDGFCILADAYRDFVSHNQLDQAMATVLEPFDARGDQGLEERCRRFQAMFVQAEIPLALSEEITRAYRALGERCGQAQPSVAVRSSVASLDGSRTSFPGQMDTYHNVRGASELLEAVKRCWASLWNVGAVVQRLALGLDPKGVIIAPVVQRMIEPDTAGVLFTVHPVTGRSDQIVINACLGLGVGVVSGRFAVDQYVVKQEDEKVASAQNLAEPVLREFGC